MTLDHFQLDHFQCTPFRVAVTISRAELCSVSGLKNVNILRVGQVLFILNFVKIFYTYDTCRYD